MLGKVMRPVGLMFMPLTLYDNLYSYQGSTADFKAYFTVLNAKRNCLVICGLFKNPTFS